MHQSVDHAIQFVRDNVHTNELENFWSLFKRALEGTYVSVEPEHLNAYTAEQTFHFHERKDSDGTRSGKDLGAVEGERITCKDLTAHVPPTAQKKDAKVEGRDPPGQAEKTMEAFKALTSRPQKVPISEVNEQRA